MHEPSIDPLSENSPKFRRERTPFILPILAQVETSSSLLFLGSGSLKTPIEIRKRYFHWKGLAEMLSRPQFTNMKVYIGWPMSHRSLATSSLAEGPFSSIMERGIVLK